jgi:AsmA family protein
VRAMMASLTGTTEVVMDEGRIASQYVELLAADLARRLMPGSGDEATKINCFVSRFDIKQGIATSTGLLFDTERMTVAGGGTVDLRQERLDLTINPEPKDASLVSLAVPLQVGGTLRSPTVAPTTASVVKGVAGLAIMGLTPLGALAALAKVGTGDQNPCVAALQQKPAPGGAAQQQQPSNPVDSVTKGVQDTFRSIFGGGK